MTSGSTTWPGCSTRPTPRFASESDNGLRSVVAAVVAAHNYVLRAVVQVAFEAAPCGVGRGDDPDPRGPDLGELGTHPGGAHPRCPRKLQILGEEPGPDQDHQEPHLVRRPAGMRQRPG
ncbi:hypothetical protein [Frankia sp. Cppng1_Ct_nod]|uniref:hypothetical protein n=1 Tax=Frankia sp. Cppng1_Ct_nod TaxID=2897162 RepID=UPI001F5EE0ED|nr:hypothetical protein [Frankia sp. Cppng1_Ct_nod]